MPPLAALREISRGRLASAARARRDALGRGHAGPKMSGVKQAIALRGADLQHVVTGERSVRDSRWGGTGWPPARGGALQALRPRRVPALPAAPQERGRGAR